MKTMPANEFEKNVQQKMEGFKLNPSGEVWQGVERRIRREKRRRGMFYLLLLGGLLLGSGVTFLLLNNKNKSDQVVQNKLSTGKDTINSNRHVPYENKSPDLAATENTDDKITQNNTGNKNKIKTVQPPLNKTVKTKT